MRRTSLIWRAVALLLLFAGCGEVFADLDVRKQTVATVWFAPAAVYSGNKAWLEVHARFEGGTAAVQGHDLNGEFNIKLLYDNLDFFPGECPDTSEFDQTSVAAVAGEDRSPIAESGEYVFCAAVEVGTFEQTETLLLGFAFWNGSESVTGHGELTVNEVTGGEATP